SEFFILEAASRSRSSKRFTNGSTTCLSSARTWSSFSIFILRSSRTGPGPSRSHFPKRDTTRSFRTSCPAEARRSSSRDRWGRLVTAGYAGDLANDAARLVPDTVSMKTVDDVTATLSYDPPTFSPGQYVHLNFHLTESSSGRPITDLKTYLGAFGHTLIMSEDMVDYVHSHPLDILAKSDDDSTTPQFVIPPGADLEKLRGGPDVTFEGLMPKAGRYRAWTQFRRNEKIYTFVFTFNVD